MRPSYQILRDALQRFGVIGGLLVAPNRGTRLAGVYESNVGQRVELPAKIVVATWPKHRSVRRKDAPWRQSEVVGRVWRAGSGALNGTSSSPATQRAVDAHPLAKRVDEAQTQETVFWNLASMPKLAASKAIRHFGSRRDDTICRRIGSGRRQFY
jgi:hypothetical protein